ncbi:MAG: ATP-binding protein [Chloroflexota bacterium]
MTDNFFLDWLTLAVSLFNTILLFWLGLTVLLNAERRTMGLFITSGTLLLGGAFFISHSAILGIGFFDLGEAFNFWLRLGFIPIIAIPFAWYAIMLWYAGFWDREQTGLRKKHRVRLIVITAMSVGMIALFAWANPIATITLATRYDPADAVSIGGIPLIVIFYPLYIVLCIASSLNVLRHPNPSQRMMGDLARRRARPWLAATAIVLLIVTLLVTALMLWVTLAASHSTVAEFYSAMLIIVAGFDLIIESLIGVSILLVGQAIVSYEVFTGKTLPRHGLVRQWRSAIILAIGFSALVSASLALHLRPIYTLLISTFIIAVFSALFSWRSFAERESYIQRLRPFVASQRLYEHLLAHPESLNDNTAITFRALCEDVLDAKLAYLIPLGASAALAGESLVYPQKGCEVSDFAQRLETLHSDQICVQIDPQKFNGASWAVPLWSERGLIGVLLLGEKNDGGLYAQEEIEIARATGERLIDMRASAETARRLLTLQRQRLAESQVMDRQTRRVLHDDILPNIHAAMLMLNNEKNIPPAIASLTHTHRQISDLLRGVPRAITLDVETLGLIGAMQETMKNELGNAFDSVKWQIDPKAEQRSKVMPPLTAEVLFCAAREAIRNAARYGRGAESASPLNLRIELNGRKGLTILIEDDGVGIKSNSTDHGGHGLSLHHTMMAIVGGSLNVESESAKFTRVILTLPESA